MTRKYSDIKIIIELREIGTNIENPISQIYPNVVHHIEYKDYHLMCYSEILVTRNNSIDAINYEKNWTNYQAIV